ncbi:lipopolysaccharide transport system ATP-binding protein [Halopseudomonas xinjiangensis]|uniref:Lipopolysaccharide transport system ATP-binding protein n=1 Tax=Halopseudomonas xinjiangensis TaxID=487184 RepID=A0A1H1NN56_9GAMM|nr:ABC transporter ATP-binding protein [Halopseudomonas xinjiangensis]SDS00422.1 lipopolysaccharide transport system ATP-binding protein [Halopseudomonas xinjiangensis]
MCSDVAIQVTGLSKCYQIYDTPQSRLKQMLMRSRKKYYREFWALRDVSFELRRGETVGIIGRNGSGKSTLLQMVCGTLNPTAGEIRTNGKIAALLELGSGFNPEFTGRENVYMSASIYGLNRSQVDERFDKIAEFADIGDHMDQPVRNYSSGMYVRLAFAVIAHVDADILVIDEALAVGDAVFTQKCMRFIRRFKETGTLLFVSHDINSVLSLCNRAVWLHAGELRETGKAKDIAENYLQYTFQEVYGSTADLETIRKDDADEEQTAPVSDDPSSCLDYSATFDVSDNLDAANGWKSGAGEITAVELVNLSGQTEGVFQGGEKVEMTIRAVAHSDLKQPILGFLVRDRLGQDLFGENTLPFTDVLPIPVSAGEAFEARYTFRLPMLPNGQYLVMASLADGDLVDNVQHHWLHDAMVINVSSSKVRWGLVGVPFEKVILKKNS